MCFARVHSRVAPFAAPPEREVEARVCPIIQALAYFTAGLGRCVQIFGSASSVSAHVRNWR
jgi:hypothetical protein